MVGGHVQLWEWRGTGSRSSFSFFEDRTAIGEHGWDIKVEWD
jgi:hypothetical protein